MEKSLKNLKSVITPLILVFLSFMLTSYTPPPAGKKVKKIKVMIKNGELKINKNDFENPWSLNYFKKAIGEVDRIDPGINDIYTYDKLGIILYKNPKSDEVTDFNIYLGKDPDENFDFIPKSLFNDLLTIESLKITNNTSLEELKNALPQYAFVKSVIGAWRGEFNNLYIYVQFDESEKNIYWLSFGIKD